MTTHGRRRLPLIAVAGSLAVALPLVLSGCSLVPHVPGLPGSGSSGGGISIPGVGSVGSGKLPSSFPKDVPLAKGEVVTGAALGSGDDAVWNVTIKVSSIGSFDDISKQLTDAGYKDGGSSAKTDDGATGSFDNGTYTIVLAVAKADDKTGWVANYTVTKSQNTNG